MNLQEDELEHEHKVEKMHMKGVKYQKSYV